MERVTRGQVEAMFRKMCAAIGKEVSTGYDSNQMGNTGKAIGFKVGTWTLDYAACYGGYVVEEYDNSGGGVSRPMGETRHSARTMWHILQASTYAAILTDPTSAELRLAAFYEAENEAYRKSKEYQDSLKAKDSVVKAMAL